MLIEWLRRHMEGWEEQLKTYLFSEEKIPEAEEDSGKEDRKRNEKNTGGKDTGLDRLKKMGDR